MRLVFIALALLLTLPVTRSAQAEYRVFRLVIKDVETKAQREVLSTLTISIRRVLSTQAR
jgi:hypothetical protein